MSEEIKKVGNIVGQGKSQGGGTYLIDGISPTLLSGMSHGNVMPFIVEIKRIDGIKKTLVFRQGILIEDILRKDKRPSNITLSNIATAIMGRDYKGLSNYANGAIEIWRLDERR